MKRIYIVALLVVFVLCACAPREFSFRGHRFGDTIEQVSKSEKDASDGDAYNGFLRYVSQDLFGDTGLLIYNFKDGKLSYIIFTLPGKFDDTKYDDIVKRLNEYGSPDESKVLSFGQAKRALWKKGNYGIAFIFSHRAYILAFVKDPEKAEKLYENPQLTNLE